MYYQCKRSCGFTASDSRNTSNTSYASYTSNTSNTSNISNTSNTSNTRYTSNTIQGAPIVQPCDLLLHLLRPFG